MGLEKIVVGTALAFSLIANPVQAFRDPIGESLARAWQGILDFAEEVSPYYAKIQEAQKTIKKKHSDDLILYIFNDLILDSEKTTFLQLASHSKINIKDIRACAKIGMDLKNSNNCYKEVDETGLGFYVSLYSRTLYGLTLSEKIQKEVYDPNIAEELRLFEKKHLGIYLKKNGLKKDNLIDSDEKFIQYCAYLASEKPENKIELTKNFINVLSKDYENTLSATTIKIEDKYALIIGKRIAAKQKIIGILAEKDVEKYKSRLNGNFLRDYFLTK